jgi:hypothetical protein
MVSLLLSLLVVLFIHVGNAENDFTSSNEITLPKAKEVALYWRKKAAEFACKIADSQDPGMFIDTTGTWCLSYFDPTKVDPTKLSKRLIDLHKRNWPDSAEPIYGKQPTHHVLPDKGLAQTIVKYLLIHPENKKKLDRNEKISLIDIGAGVGQYGIWFQTNEEASTKITWQGYDGAGNVESFTNGRVKWIDVSSPLFDSIEPSNYRADFIMSLEVGEHSIGCYPLFDFFA